MTLQAFKLDLEMEKLLGVSAQDVIDHGESALRRVIAAQTDHLEMMAAAYLQRVSVDPDHVVLVEEHDGTEIKWHYEERMFPGDMGKKFKLADTDQWQACVQELADFLRQRDASFAGMVAGLTLPQFKVLWLLYIKARAHDNARENRRVLLDDINRLRAQRDYARAFAEWADHGYEDGGNAPDPLPKHYDDGWRP